jgi:hypothetical protein
VAARTCRPAGRIFPGEVRIYLEAARNSMAEVRNYPAEALRNFSAGWRNFLKNIVAKEHFNL